MREPGSTSSGPDGPRLLACCAVLWLGALWVGEGSLAWADDGEPAGRPAIINPETVETPAGAGADGGSGAASQWGRAWDYLSPVLTLGLLLWGLSLQLRLNSRNQDFSGALSELEQANRRLGELASSDSLTGLANRRHFHEVAWQELARARRYGGPLALVLLDIDHVRTINDRYGQHIGDQALVHLAQLMQRHLRDTDLLARHAGEEFILLLPGTNLDGAQQLMERMLDGARGHPMLLADEQVPVLFSAGVAVFERDENDLDTLLARADGAMKRAKQSGRGQVLS